METWEKMIRKRTKSTNNSPRDEAEQKKESSPRLKISSKGSRDSSPVPDRAVVCPRCKTSKEVVLLGKWKERDADVYFCGLTYPDDRACRNVWLPEFSYLQVTEAKITYLPGLDGDYVATFTFA